MSFASIFNKFMEELGITNKKVAQILNVHQTTIARWRKEADAKPDDVNHIERFAQHYRLNLEEENALREAAGFAKKIEAQSELQVISYMAIKPWSAIEPEENFIPRIIAPANYKPFVVSQPVTKKHFFGREKILQKLFELWNAYPAMPIQNAAIWGEKRIGKTSILKHIKALTIAQDTELRPEQVEQRQKWLPNADRYNFIYVDFQNKKLQSQAGLLSYGLKEMHLIEDEVDLARSNNPLYDFIELVSEHLHKPTVIMLDEIGTVLHLRDSDKEEKTVFDFDFWENLRALATTEFDPARLGFLLSSPENPQKLQGLASVDDRGICSPFFNIFGSTIQVAAFSEQEARALINSSAKPFAEEIIESILAASLKPYDLQRYCREQYESQ